MEKKQISPVIIVSLLIVGLSLLTAAILLYTERINNENEDDANTPVEETSLPVDFNDNTADFEGSAVVEGLSEESELEETPLTDAEGEVDIDLQIRALEAELEQIDAELYSETDINDSSLGL